MKIQKLFIHVFLPVITAVLIMSCAYADESGFNVLFSGNITEPVAVSIQSPQFQQLSQFGKERTESLNRVLKHLSLCINTDGSVSETTFYTDRSPMFSVKERRKGKLLRSVFSFRPDVLYQRSDTEETDDSFRQFLDGQFFLLNRMFDQYYHVFSKAGENFLNFTKTGISGINYKEYGKAIGKKIIQFPSDYVKEFFPKAIADLCDTEDSRQFIEQLHFKGAQRITLLFDQNDKLMYVGFSGTVGLNEESMRKVTFTWKCLRSENRKKDNLIMKTPSVKGYDKYNLTYERDIHATDPDHQNVLWDFQLDLKEGENKKKIQYNADIDLSDGKLGGNVQFTEKQNGREYIISVIPELQKEKKHEFSGTIEITSKKGKIVVSSMNSLLRISPAAALNAPEPDQYTLTDLDGEEGRYNADQLQTIINQILIRNLVALPEEDTLFFRQGIPEETWKSILY